MTTLTAQQLAAANAPADMNVVVEAVAGAGKTTLLAQRIVTLIERDGIDPAHIVLATYSKSQADDMALRIFSRFPQLRGTALENGFGEGKGQITTLHALAKRMLEAYSPELRSRQLAKEWKERSLIEEAVRDLAWTIERKGVWEPVGWKSIHHWITKAKAHVSETGELLKWGEFDLRRWAEDQFKPEDARNFAKVAVAYQDGLRRANMWTFSDMLRECEARLKSDSDFREHWAAKITHLLIDEAQDTNGQCMRLAALLGSTVFLTGDADQCIFAFQGATPSINLRDGFNARYGSHSERHKMTVCFRCQPKVLHHAGTLIRHNYSEGNFEYYKDIEARPEPPSGPDLHFSWYLTPEEEAQAVVQEIADRMTQGDLVPGDIMIMSRLNAQMALIEIELLRRGIPFVNLGLSSFFNRRIPRIVIAFAELALRRPNWGAFEAVYNIPSKWYTDRQGEYVSTRYLGREFLDKLNRLENDPVTEASRHKNALNKKGWAQWTRGVLDMEEVFLRLREYTEDDSAIAFVQELCEEVLNPWIEAEFGVEDDASESVRDDLAMVSTMAAQFTLGQFLAYVGQLQATKDVKPEHLTEYVLIGTIYRFKGLERNAVRVIGMSEGILPHRFSMGVTPPTDGLPVPSATTIWDERNLAYVALTRAIHECYLSGVETWPTIKEKLNPSRFIEEMGLTIEEVAAD